MIWYGFFCEVCNVHQARSLVIGQSSYWREFIVIACLLNPIWGTKTWSVCPILFIALVIGQVCYPYFLSPALWFWTCACLCIDHLMVLWITPSWQNAWCFCFLHFGFFVYLKDLVYVTISWRNFWMANQLCLQKTIDVVKLQQQTLLNSLQN